MNLKVTDVMLAEEASTDCGGVAGQREREFNPGLCALKVRACSSSTGYVTACCQLYRGKEGEEVLAVVRGARRREREYAGRADILMI